MKEKKFVLKKPFILVQQKMPNIFIFVNLKASSS